MKNKKQIRLFLMILLVGIMMIGCAEKSEETVEESMVKEITFATSVELGNLSPLMMSPENQVACKLVYDTLLTYKDDMIQPMLAESWSFNEAGTELTLNLRQDVVFHNGTKFNAEVVKKNLEFYHTNPNAGFMLAAGNLEKVEVVDEYTCVLHFPTPYFAYLNDLCQPDVMVMVEPSMIEEGNFQTMKGVIGTGPYVYETIVPGEYTLLKKSDTYWAADDYEYDKITIKYIHEDTTRLQALQNKELDFLYGSAFLTYDDYQQGIAIPGVEGKLSEKYSQTRNLALNAALPELSDVRVREAIEYALDKEMIASGLTYNMDDPAYDIYPKDLPYSNVESIKRVYNIEKANALLDDAGYKVNDETGIREKDGQPLKLVFTYDSGDVMNQPLATVIQSQLKVVGIDIELLGQDMFTWWMGSVEGAYGLTIWNIPLDAFAVPHLNMTPWINSTPQTPAIYALEDGQACVEAITEFMVTKDEKRVQELFDYLIMYSDKNVLNIPLTYSREYMLYRSEVIDGYDFTDTPKYFEADDLK